MLAAPQMRTKSEENKKSKAVPITPRLIQPKVELGYRNPGGFAHGFGAEKNPTGSPGTSFDKGRQLPGWLTGWLTGYSTY